ncbi:hypothetical protein PHEL49_2453 [Polaribacter sp. Hel1_33_49]|nr:hypothetical protein PHEL49_2453 [Polaribacter sp. Hel1_33_49]
MLLYNLSVVCFKKNCNGPFVKTLNPSSSKITPKSKTATPAAIVLKFGLKYRIIASITKKVGNNIFLIIKKKCSCNKIF